MTRTSMSALAGVCALALCATFAAAKPGAAPAASSAQAAPGTEPLSTGETPQEAEEKGDSVASIVNDTVITDYELRQRVGLFLATSSVRPTPEMIKKVRAQVLSQLETERIELLEAQKNKITVSASDVDKAIGNIVKDNRLSEDQLTQMLARNNVAMATLRSQIAAQVAWSKTVQQQYGDRVDVKDEDVTLEMHRIAEGRNKPHYLVSEIFQAVDNPEDDNRVLKSMQTIEDQLRSGATFPDVARQFSQNPTAASGGDMGIVIDGQLPAELNAALGKMRPGTLSDPIKSVGGYYILLLRARQEAEGAAIPDPNEKPADEHPQSLPLARVLLPIGPKPPKEVLDKVVAFANGLREHIGSCDGLGDMIHKIKGAVYMNLGTMKLTDLSPQIQEELGKTRGGESTTPFQSAAGIEVFVRCDKGPGPRMTAFKMPARDDIEESLFEQRMAVLSRQYLRDLRRDADIEKPGQPLGPRKRSDASAQ